jgi:F1F0 ATPase subunit 2
MAMSDSLGLVLAWLAGIVLGAIFFGGLWWTVRKGLSSGQPAFWFLGSMLLRMGIVLAGFFLVADKHLGRLLVCLIGFVMARMVVTQMTQTRPVREARHAP